MSDKAFYEDGTRLLTSGAFEFFLDSELKRAVILATEAPIRKEISHGIAMAAHRAAPVTSGARQPQAVRATAPAPADAHHAGAAAAPTSPAAIAAAAAEAGNYSLKDISRTAAREAERELIFKMLQQTRWNRKETAEILGISYKALLYKIKENGLDKAS